MGWGGEGAEFHPFLVLTARVTGSTAAARQGMSSGRIICCQLQWVERLFRSKRVGGVAGNYVALRSSLLQ